MPQATGTFTDQPTTFPPNAAPAPPTGRMAIDMPFACALTAQTRRQLPATPAGLTGTL